MRLFPIVGMSNVKSDDELVIRGKTPSTRVRDAVNIDITASGRLALRKGAELATNIGFKNLWQSPLHKDVFATLDNQLVKVDPYTWDYEVIRDGINPSVVCFEVVNNAIFISTTDDIYIYTGAESAHPLTIDTPAQPLIKLTMHEGQLKSGTYVAAISWLRDGIESGLSETASYQVPYGGNRQDFDPTIGKLTLNLPYCLDPSVTGVRVYVTTRNGSALLHHADYPVETLSATITDVEKLGMPAKFEYLSPMPSGRILRYWQGRLLSVDKNMIRFSQPMAYHLHDERHDFVMMPQRITFMLPVDGGIWVGQVDHVVFLSGNQPSEMSFVKKTSQAPVPNSAICLDAEQVGSDIAQGGAKTALWLSANGYVLGTSGGQVIELHAGVMKGISAKSGTSVVVDRRVQTIVV